MLIYCINGSCSLPTWQDCHEMWCKKRRRKGEGKGTEDGGSAKQTRRESVADNSEASNKLPALPATEEQRESSIAPLESSSFPRRQSIETIEMETEDMATNAYASKDGHSFYDREQLSQYSYTEEHPKAAYLEDSYYQRDYRRDYPEGSGNHSYKTALDDYSHPYSREDADNERRDRYSQSSMQYEQLSPPTDQGKRSYPDRYRHYSFTDGGSNKEYDEMSSRYREDSYLYRERYPEDFSRKHEVFDYNDSQYDRYPVAPENRGQSPHCNVESYPRW